MTSNPCDVLEDQEFYELMQAYRHAYHLDQATVTAAFEAVKDWLRRSFRNRGPDETDEAEYYAERAQGIAMDADNDALDAARYHWLREHWDQMTGNTWREPIGPKLDKHIDEQRRAAKADEQPKLPGPQSAGMGPGGVTTPGHSSVKTNDAPGGIVVPPAGASPGCTAGNRLPGDEGTKKTSLAPSADGRPSAPLSNESGEPAAVGAEDPRFGDDL